MKYLQINCSFTYHSTTQCPSSKNTAHTRFFSCFNTLNFEPLFATSGEVKISLQSISSVKKIKKYIKTLRFKTTYKTVINKKINYLMKRDINYNE